MFEVLTKLDPYEINGEKIKSLPYEADELHVKRHRIQNRDLVVLDWRGHNITVSASQLITAIRNATSEWGVTGKGAAMSKAERVGE